MDVYYSDEIPKGIIFEANGVLVIGTKKEEHQPNVNRQAG